jgi:hypothetical protein
LEIHIGPPIYLKDEMDEMDGMGWSGVGGGNISSSSSSILFSSITAVDEATQQIRSHILDS